MDIIESEYMWRQNGNYMIPKMGRQDGHYRIPNMGRQYGHYRIPNMGSQDGHYIITNMGRQGGKLGYLVEVNTDVYIHNSPSWKIILHTYLVY